MTTRQKLIAEKVAELGDLLKMEYEEASKAKECSQTRIAGVLHFATFDDVKKQIKVTSITGGANDDFKGMIANMDQQLKSILLCCLTPRTTNNNSLKTFDSIFKN